VGALQYCTLTCSDISYVVNQLCQSINSPNIEIEYHSIALATTKLHWIQMLFWDLGISIPCPPTLWCGNVCDNARASNIIFMPGRSMLKLITILYYFIREKIVNKDILVWRLTGLCPCKGTNITTLHFLAFQINGVEVLVNLFLHLSTLHNTQLNTLLQMLCKSYFQTVYSIFHSLYYSCPVTLYTYYFDQYNSEVHVGQTCSLSCLS
jgi:hypothetical protein